MGLELGALHLQSRLSTARATPPVKAIKYDCKQLPNVSLKKQITSNLELIKAA
jgi:hypothetical protein